MLSWLNDNLTEIVVRLNSQVGVTPVCRTLQVVAAGEQEVEEANKHSKNKVRGLEEETDVLNDRDGAWERKITALEELVKDRQESGRLEVRVDKERTSDAVRVYYECVASILEQHKDMPSRSICAYGTKFTCLQDTIDSRKNNWKDDYHEGPLGGWGPGAGWDPEISECYPINYFFLCFQWRFLDQLSQT
ncbi:hypothetical protein KCU65_g1938, partial [Aureobasidium melanogenum]